MMQGMPGMPPGMPPVSMPPSRPLFPSAATVSTAASSAANATPLGADFKPITSVAGGSIGPVKPTFPAYGGAGEANANSASSGNEQKVNLIATTGAASKIIHPPEDLSLVRRRFVPAIS